MSPRQLSDVLVERLGTKAIPYTNRLNVASIGITAVRVLTTDPNRFEWLFINLSPNLIYLLNENTVSASKGIQVGASGGSVSMQWDEDFELVSNEWWAVAVATPSNYLAVELVSAGA